MVGAAKVPLQRGMSTAGESHNVEIEHQGTYALTKDWLPWRLWLCFDGSVRDRRYNARLSTHELLPVDIRRDQVSK